MVPCTQHVVYSSSIQNQLTWPLTHTQAGCLNLKINEIMLLLVVRCAQRIGDSIQITKDTL